MVTPTHQKISRDTFLILINIWLAVFVISLISGDLRSWVGVACGFGLAVYYFVGLIRSDPNDGVEQPKAKQIAASRPKKVRLKAGLGDKIPFPKKGESWDWHVRYFDVGDSVTWKKTCGPDEGEVKTETVTGVRRNQFGRISYETQSCKFIMAEEVQAAQCT